MIDLEKARPYLRGHRGKLFVVKIGGECLATEARLARLAAEVALVEALGPKLVLVHGSGPQTDALLLERGEESQKVAGRRVTSPAGLRALCHATLGELNAQLASALTAQEVPAVGLCVASGDVLVAERRPPVEVDGRTVDFGAVGDVRRVNPKPIRLLLEGGFLPVLCPPASDGAGGLLNVNADLAAAHLALALGADKLVLVTGAPGVLADAGDPSSLVSTLTRDELVELERTGGVVGGMRVKAEAMRLALDGGVERVHVVSGRRAGALASELYTAHGSGTMITRDRPQDVSVVNVPALVPALEQAAP